MPNTPGVSGSGTLVGIVVKGLTPGNSQLSIVQVNAKDSEQRPIQVITGEATVRVQYGKRVSSHASTDFIPAC